MKKLIFLVLGILMLSTVYALGVTPGRTTIDFKPGLQKTVNFKIINSGGENVELTLSADGELAKYMTLPSKRISISASESSRSLNYTVNLPETLRPGLRTGKVLITEVPKKTKEGESYVAATLSVAIQLHVNVPYPGKYASSKMIVYNSAPGKDVTFVFPVISRGEFDLTSVRANVDIYNSLNKKVDSFNTNSVGIPSGKKKEIVYKWKANVPIGNYRAVATVIYDGGTINLEKTFTIGSRNLELQEISVNNFHLGEIAKLEMLVENKWSEQISDAYIETKILNDGGDVVADFKSASYNIAPLAKQVFLSYWDTAGVKAGNYQTEVAINYGGKSSKKDLEFRVSKNDLTIIGLGYVISPEEKPGGTNTLLVVLVIAVIILIFINLLWFFLLRKRLKK